MLHDERENSNLNDLAFISGCFLQLLICPFNFVLFNYIAPSLTASPFFLCSLLWGKKNQTKWPFRLSSPYRANKVIMIVSSFLTAFKIWQVARKPWSTRQDNTSKGHCYAWLEVCTLLGKTPGQDCNSVWPLVLLELYYWMVQQQG